MECQMICFPICIHFELKSFNQTCGIDGNSSILYYNTVVKKPCITKHSMSSMTFTSPARQTMRICIKGTINPECATSIQPVSSNSRDRIRHLIPQTEPKSCLMSSAIVFSNDQWFISFLLSSLSTLQKTANDYIMLQKQ